MPHSLVMSSVLTAVPVGITKTRYAITYGLLADAAAVIAAIWVAYLFFH